ncbi:MAG: SRPBCC family protein [Rhizobacter sp.]|nr:SRPBCC family protein [Ferruginibacter sp.]
MKILKFLLVFIVSIIVIVLVAALLIKKDYKIEKEISINKPRQQVFDYVKYLKNQYHYSHWATLDTNMQKTYTGTDATPGFIAAWKGNKKAGIGEQEIIKIEDGKRIDYALRFKEPMESNMNSYMTTEDATSNTTTVKWTMYGTQKYPWNVMNPFMDAMMGDDLEIGLSNLKKLMEAQ